MERAAQPGERRLLEAKGTLLWLHPTRLLQRELHKQVKDAFSLGPEMLGHINPRFSQVVFFFFEKHAIVFLTDALVPF